MQCLIDYFSQGNHSFSVDNDPMEQMIGPSRNANKKPLTIRFAFVWSKHLSLFSRRWKIHVLIDKEFEELASNNA